MMEGRIRRGEVSGSKREYECCRGFFFKLGRWVGEHLKMKIGFR